MTLCRIAYVTPHPTQFEVPLFRYLNQQQDVDLTAFFTKTSSFARIHDPEIGGPPGWDFPAEGGYRSYTLRGGPARIVQLAQRVLLGRRFDLVIVPGWGTWDSRFLLMLGALVRAPIALHTDTTSIYAERGTRQRLRDLILRKIGRAHV